MSCQTGRSGPAQAPFSFPTGYDNWWSPGPGFCPWAAYQPKGAASLAASYTDLTGNGNNAGVGVAPTWDAANGWKFNGTTQYLTTTFVPEDDQSQSMLVRFTGGSGSTVLMGMYNSADKSFYLIPTVTVIYSNGGRILTGSPTASGVMGVAGDTGYMDGSPTVTGLAAWPSATTDAVYIGVLNFNGAPVLFFPGQIQAVAIYDCALTAGQVALVAAEMAAL